MFRRPVIVRPRLDEAMDRATRSIWSCQEWSAAASLELGLETRIHPQRVALFASGGPAPLAAVNALAETTDVVALVRPVVQRGVLGRLRGGGKALLQRTGLREEDPLDRWASRARVPVLRAASGDDPAVARDLRALGPSVGCIVTFPWRLGSEVLAAAGSICLNVHPSLLPRHRGADPIFWTYHAGDEEGGVTVHQATDVVDGGDVLGAVRVPIGRGDPVTRIHRRYSEVGADLLVDVVGRVASGRTSARSQDESAATLAPRVLAGRVYGNFDQWTAEHAWHFLAGLVERYREPFLDESSIPVTYSQVPGWESYEPASAPGSVVRHGGAWRVWARDGFVELAP